MICNFEIKHLSAIHVVYCRHYGTYTTMQKSFEKLLHWAYPKGLVTTEECDADEHYKQTYIQAEKEDIVIVKSPVGMPGRAIRNTFLDKVKSEGRIPPTKCLRCIHTCNPAETPYCITEALIHAAKGETENALLFCGGRAYEAKTIETVKKVIDYFCSSCI